MTWKTNKTFDLSTYLQELVEGFSQTKSSNTESLEPVKSSSTPETCSFKDKKTDASLSSRSGMTSERLTESLGGEQLTFLQGDFPAKTSPPPEKEKGLPESVRDYGLNLKESLKRCGLSLSSSKTARCLELADLSSSSKDLPAWGMMQNGVSWELGTSARLIKETECGYLPTPCANEDAAGTPAGKMQRMLGNCVEVRGENPEDWKRGTLNPTWVEWLMGWPIGWTDLKPLEMDKSPNAQLWRGDY